MTIKKLMRISIGAVVISILAPIKLMIGVVPFSLSLLGVLLVSFLLPSKDAILAVLLYWTLIILGFPATTSSIAGPAAFVTPISGYLLGYIMIPLVLWLGNRQNNILTLVHMITLSIIGVLGLYLMGALGLMFSKGFTFLKAIQIGVLPFIWIDSIKIAIAYMIYSRIKKYI